MQSAKNSVIRRCQDVIWQRKHEGTYRVLQNCSHDSLDFSSNDYLGFAKNQECLDKACQAAKLYGNGSTGSRLLSGNKAIFMEFESVLASDIGMESALIFNSGFQANSGILECLCDRETTVFFDYANHASMYQGVFASPAKLLRYNHVDYDHLASLLKNLVQTGHQKIIIVSETIFGMDGDKADLNILSDLSNRYGAILYLDEAHAIGLYGHNGYGLATDISLNPETTLIMGTFSKALGSSGAFIACSKLIKEFLLQRCRSFIYSTALSPFCIGAAMQAWHMVKSRSDLRQHVHKLADTIRLGLKERNVRFAGNGTHIIPLLFDDIQSMQNMAQHFEKNHIRVAAIRRPTAPTPRIRISLNANLTDQDIDLFLSLI